MSLMEKGVVTNLNKKFLPGKIVTTFVMGSKKICEYDEGAGAFPSLRSNSLAHTHTHTHTRSRSHSHSLALAALVFADDFVDDNPAVSFMDAAIANHPAVIAQNPRVTAINSAVEIDLTGQVCADSIGETLISGVGGQVDFERGAALSPGGVPIICLPSTTSKGESRIVPLLKLGAGVVTTRPHVHFVVTEVSRAKRDWTLEPS